VDWGNGGSDLHYETIMETDGRNGKKSKEYSSQDMLLP
jgi:hypothetical protein